MAYGRVPVFVAPHTIGLDDNSDLFPIQGSGSHKRSVFRLAQEFLNASQACTWALVSNGRRLRLLRDADTLTRPCFLEFDLETILDGNRYPDPDVVAAKNKAERDKRIALLAEGKLACHLAPEQGQEPSTSVIEQQLYREFIQARRTAEAVSLFVHLKKNDHVKKDEGGRFPLTGVGDVNTYALFAETISQLSSPQGRAGFIVPTGIATDDSTKKFFSTLIQQDQLRAIYSFENEEFIFKSVHHSFRFCLMVLGKNSKSQPIDLAFFLRNIGQLSEQNRHFSLNREDFALLNPNTQTCPVFRSRMDAEMTRKIYSRVPVLIREAQDDESTGHQPEENPWGIRFMAMFHMANDSHLFADTASPERLPLYEAKMVHQFDHRWAEYRRDAAGEATTVDVTAVDKQNPAYNLTPRYWVAARERELAVTRMEHDILKKAAAYFAKESLHGNHMVVFHKGFPRFLSSPIRVNHRFSTK